MRIGKAQGLQCLELSTSWNWSCVSNGSTGSAGIYLQGVADNRVTSVYVVKNVYDKRAPLAEVVSWLTMASDIVFTGSERSQVDPWLATQVPALMSRSPGGGLSTDQLKLSGARIELSLVGLTSWAMNITPN